MFRFSQSLEMDHAAPVVWSYLIAFEQVPLWEHGIIEVRQVAPGAPAVGTEISARRIYAGRRTELGGRIVELEDGRSATLLLQGGPLDEAFVTYSVDPIDDRRSIITYSAHGNLIGPLRFLHPILPGIGRAEARRNLASLKRRIDSAIPPRSSAVPPPMG